MPDALSCESLTVAMITRNEMGAISKVIGDIRHAVPGAEILVVDSSSDRTAEVAQELGARVIKQFPPRGYGPAMDTALRSAVARSWLLSIATIPTPPMKSPISPG